MLLGSQEWWGGGGAHSVVGYKGCLSACLHFGTPSQGSPGRACDMGLALSLPTSSPRETTAGMCCWPWPGRHLMAWQLPCPALPASGPGSGMQGSNFPWRVASQSGVCTHLEWNQPTLGINALHTSNPCVEWEKGCAGSY